MEARALQQPFDYMLVLDFEATCDGDVGALRRGERSNRPWPSQEIIEFPTVLIDARTMSVVDEFQSYVMPLRNPQLSSFCTDLTGIQQEWVDSAPAFADVLRRHTAWLQQHGLGAEGADGRSMAFVTCGDWDLKTMLPAQLALERDHRVPQHFRQWININRIYSQCRLPAGAEKASGMAGMLRGLGLSLDGRHHSGIDDCRNIAKIVCALAEIGRASCRERV